MTTVLPAEVTPGRLFLPINEVSGRSTATQDCPVWRQSRNEFSVQHSSSRFVGYTESARNRTKRDPGICPDMARTTLGCCHSRKTVVKRGGLGCARSFHRMQAGQGTWRSASSTLLKRRPLLTVAPVLDYAWRLG